MNMNDKRKNLILAVPSNKIEGVDVGFTPMGEDELISVLEKAGSWFGPRPDLEIDNSYLQLIPYVILMYEDKVIRYRRTPKGGESRLHDRLSIGVGGHIDIGDVIHAPNDEFHVKSTIKFAARRELVEEVPHIKLIDGLEWIGFLRENATLVDQVHLGLVAIGRISENPIGEVEEALSNVELIKLGEIDPNDPSLEKWSSRMVEYLQNNKH